MFTQRLKILMDEQCDGKQSVLAKKSNLPKTVISSYFCRGSQPSLSQLIALSSALDCTIDYLAGIEPDIEDSIFTKQTPLPNNEQALLDNFRKLPVDLQHRASVYMQKLVEVIDDERQTAFPVKKSTRAKRVSEK